MPTVVSTFAGCGGSSLGYKMAGFKELLAVDFDARACETFRLNFPEVPCWQRDICGVTVDEIMAFCDIKKGDLDVLDGSPPCQGFSTAGKRQVTDARNSLFNEYVRLIDGLRPKVFVMENVTGMVKGTMKGAFKEIMRTLKLLPYRVECRKLNAMWYGVPQSRERLFFMGIRNDLGKSPAWPKHTGKRPITVGAILANVEQSAQGDDRKGGKFCPRIFGDRILAASKSAPMLTRLSRFYIEKHSPEVLAAWEKARPGQSLRKATKYVGSYQSCRLDANKPSMTLIKAHRHWHYNEPRQLSDIELKRICSFPDEFILAGSKSQRGALLGNSVMPLQMKAIAETIRTKILNNKDTNEGDL